MGKQYILMLDSYSKNGYIDRTDAGIIASSVEEMAGYKCFDFITLDIFKKSNISYETLFDGELMWYVNMIKFVKGTQKITPYNLLRLALVDLYHRGEELVVRHLDELDKGAAVSPEMIAEELKSSEDSLSKYLGENMDWIWDKWGLLANRVNAYI